MKSSLTLRVPGRVRALYLELMALSQELEGTRITSGTVDKSKHERPYLYLRLDSTEAAAAADSQSNRSTSPTPSARAAEVMAAVTGVVLTGSSSSTSTSTSPRAPVRQHERHHTHGFTYRIASEDAARLDVLFPPHWRNHGLCTPAVGPQDVSFTSYYRAEVQAAFYQCALLHPGGAEWKRALARGRVQLRKLQELLHMKKYRAMRKRYDWAAQLSTDDLVTAFGRACVEGAGADDTHVDHRVREAQLGLANRDVYGYRTDE